ncbi:MAG: hypothetical protein NWR47_06120 [Aestuariivirgaceae bacterium]|nr:hypothetical protein [Aestuariivirgaceae bacterium]
MNNTKWLRRALLGGAGLCLMASAAQAEYTLNLSPVADMPAPTTEVTISGNVRGLITSQKTTGDDWETDLSSRLRLYIKGKTETAIGEVGVYSRLQAVSGGEVDASSYYGYWKISPSVTFTAGHNDTIAAVIYGADWNGTGGVWNSGAVVLTDPLVNFVSLGFGSGPITATVGVETNRSANAASDETLEGDMPAIAGSLNLRQGDLSAQVSTRFQGSDGTPEGENSYMVGGGIGYSAGIAALELGAATGKGMAKDFTTFDLSNLDALGTEFTALNALLTLRMSETTRIETFAGYGKLSLSSGLEDAGNPEKMVGVGSGVFWPPVSQLTLGAGASWAKTNFDTDEGLDVKSSKTTTAGVGAWFSF